MLTEQQIVKLHKKIIAKMVHAFILQAAYKPEAKVKELYASFAQDWGERVRKVNARYGKFLLSFDVWDREWKEEGYLKFISIPVPKQLPEEEKKKLIAQKTELIRLVFIVEGKTEHQRQRRETYYKFLFIKMRIKTWIKSLFAKK